jgi:hypothetical protein
MIENPEFDPLGAGDANDVIYTAISERAKETRVAILCPKILSIV